MTDAILLIGVTTLLSLATSTPIPPRLLPPVLAFYSLQYQTKPTYHAWNHQIYSKTGYSSSSSWAPPLDICSTFYPQLGVYASTDKHILTTHMRQLATNGVNMVVVPWWLSTMEAKKQHAHDGRFKNGVHAIDERVPRLLEAAAEHGILVTFLLKDHRGRSIQNVIQRLNYLTTAYSYHPALYKNINNGLVLFIENIMMNESNLFSHTHISNTHPHHKELQHHQYIGYYGKQSSFSINAQYKYIYVKNEDEWNRATTSRINDYPASSVVFVISPGKNELRLRPWLKKQDAVVDRRNGQEYAGQWINALALGASTVLIDSFNDWCSSTQIEPASSEVAAQLEQVCANGKCKKSGLCKEMMARLNIDPMYQTYGSGGSEMYLELTKKYSGIFVGGGGGADQRENEKEEKEGSTSVTSISPLGQNMVEVEVEVEDGSSTSKEEVDVEITSKLE